MLSCNLCMGFIGVMCDHSFFLMAIQCSTIVEFNSFGGIFELLLVWDYSKGSCLEHPHVFQGAYIFLFGFVFLTQSCVTQAGPELSLLLP